MASPRMTEAEIWAFVTDAPRRQQHVPAGI
jgi:hypothetical protein